MASCGKASGRGRSYSVMMTCVALPLGRGNVFRSYGNVDEADKLMLAANSAVLPMRFCCASVGSISPPVAGEALQSVFIAHNRERDFRARAFGAHQDAFHRTFLLRGNVSGQGGSGGSLCVRSLQGNGPDCERNDDESAKT